jgi:hypothetical protein
MKETEPVMVLLLQRQLISAACSQQTSHRRIAQALASTGCFHPVLGLLDDLADRVKATHGIKSFWRDFGSDVANTGTVGSLIIFVS